MRRVALLGALLLVCASIDVRAQRELHWDALDVDARLDAEGVLHVTEVQKMVFTGDWNGGERVFNLRPYHRLSDVSVARLDPATGQEQPLTEDDSLDEVDEFSMRDERTLRWRSRLPSDTPFSSERRTYVIRYTLSRILTQENNRYRLDHDFAFPDRAGTIERFSLQLALDPAWQAESEVRERYAAGPLAPGQRFPLTIDLRHQGAAAPIAVDIRRQPSVIAAVTGMAAVIVLAVAAFFRRESKLGRFARLPAESVDADWIARNILTLPAEVVGATWDGSIGAPEVVALIARMVADGKLSSETGVDGSLILTLKVDRDSLHGYELALVKGLFVDGSNVTSTDKIKTHYKKTGFDPAKVIEPKLEARVKEALPAGTDPVVGWHLSAFLLLCVFGLLAYDGFLGAGQPGPFIFAVAAVAFGLLAKLPGLVLFRHRIDWGPRGVVLCLVPALLAATGIAAFLWFLATPDALNMPPVVVAAIALLGVWIVHSALNALKSRQSAEAIAFRKKLAAGRQFFMSELQRERPALQDSWFPWVLAFGLAGKADQWSRQYAPSHENQSGWTPSTMSGSSSSASGWTGFGGGRSGGAGATGAWAAAASGMAAGVAAPSSSSSSSGGGGGSSSGGGGGGGW